MKIITVIIMTTFLTIPCMSMAASKVYTFAVVPQQAASEMAETWSPFLVWVSENSGVELRFVTAPDIPTFEKRLSKGEYDFAYMNPYHYTVFHKKPGYEALAKEKNRKLKGILVVRKDSKINSINELAGSTIVFPSPAAFAASILPRSALMKAGVMFKTKFVSSHESVYLNVEKGLYPAGGGIIRTFEMMDNSISKNLRVLWTTPQFTPHAIATHPKLPHDIAKKVLNSFLKMSSDPVGQQKLELIGFKGIDAAGDSDWNDVRHLNIADIETRGE